MRKISWILGFVACFGLLVSVSSVSAAERIVEVRIPLENRVEGNPSHEETFSFLLEPKGQAPMPEEDRITVSGSGKSSFLPIIYTDSGTYHYTLREIKGSHSSYTYDDVSYDVTVFVSTDDTNILSAIVSVAKDGSEAKSNQALFVNTYHTNPTKPSTEDPNTSAQFSMRFWIGLATLSLVVFGFMAHSIRKKCS